MNWADVVIVLIALGAALRGYRVGLVRQLGSTAGFIAGMLLGSWWGGVLASGVQSSSDKSLLSLFTTLCGAFLGMAIGETLGAQLKHRFNTRKVWDRFDGSFGSGIAALTLLFACWLLASLLVLGQTSPVQRQLKDSRILGILDVHLPPATAVLSSLDKLINPNHSPQVFRGREPSPANVTVPPLSSFEAVVAAARPSVVKVEGTGCGGIVEGSGFVFAPGAVATNAHVVAGVASPKVRDARGIHNTRVVWFDPDTDLAVLRADDLTEAALPLDHGTASTGTPAVVLGYPAGGNFSAQPAAIVDTLTAIGRNIYNQSVTTRSIYSLKAHVVHGNSGGPMVGRDGHVIGIVFATSTTYNDIGYALTGGQVATSLHTAARATKAVSTGACSEE